MSKRKKNRPVVSRFLALDGEAEGPRYTMLCSSERDLLECPEGIPTELALEWLSALWERETRRKRLIAVGFAFSYDVNMILADLPLDTLRTLWEAGEVVWRVWAIRYRHRREFAWRRVKPAVSRWFRVWDVFGFFQASFVKTCKAWGVLSPAELERMERMKAQRSSFTAAAREEIREYCFSECSALAEIMERLKVALETAGIKLQRWDGAGAVAGALLSAHRMKDFHIPQEEPRKNLIRTIARNAYYGGRIESIRFGRHQGPLYLYDIRSAYPDALRTAPCLSCGSWSTDTTKALRMPYRLFHVEWELDGPALPFPWRCKDGTVLYPPKGAGWYWSPEFSAAQQAKAAGAIVGDLRVTHVLGYSGCSAHDPWAWLPEVYESRRAYKAAGNMAEYPLKLGINSVYGKTAQRARSGRSRPPQQQIAWASYCTSYTRARLYQASIPALLSDSLVSYATDGLITTEPLPQLPISEKLGDWSVEEYSSGTFVMPGIYWLGEQLHRSRGWVSGELTKEQVWESWKRGQWEYPVSVTRFIGMGAALKRIAPLEHWRQWEEQERTLTLHPWGVKRLLESGSLTSSRPLAGLVGTWPAGADRYQQLTLESTPLKFAAWDAGVPPETSTADDESDDAQL